MKINDVQIKALRSEAGIAGDTVMKDECLFPECTQPGHCRGLCITHYTSAARYVKLGRASWETLERLGKCKAGLKKPNNSWFLDGNETA